MKLDELLPNVRLADILDILIVSALIGFFLYWGSRRKNPKVLVAGVMLVALYVLAFALDLYMTRMMLQTAVSALLFMIVVLFQNELRLEFDRLISWRPFGRHFEVRETTIDAVAKAIELMSSENIGALLVFPGNQSIERHCRAGSRVDAEVSVELLHSIFHPQSQGHDGAVIICNERIARIGVHLPLSTDLTKIKKLGTRHCAALGLSERTDAVICVLSEEKGTVSFAVGGELTTVTSGSSVKDQLRQLITEPGRDYSKQRTPWQGVNYVNLIKHAAIVVLSIILASALWFMFAFEVQTIQQTIADVPVELHNVPDGWEVDGPFPSQVTLSLVGPKRAFDVFESTGIKVVVDLQAVAYGQNWLQIDQRHLQIPDDVRLHSVEPSRLRFELQRASSVKSD